MKSFKRKRPPDDSDFEDVTPRPASLRLRSREPSRLCSVKRLRVAPTDEIVPKSNSKPKQKRSLRIWRLIKQRLRDVLGQLRVLLFSHIEDERVCLRLRGFLQFHQWSVSWLALLQSECRQQRSLPALLQDLDKCAPKNKTEELDPLKIGRVLSALLARILGSDITQYRPLLEKLPKTSRLAMDRMFGDEYTRELSSGNSLQDLSGFESWSFIHKREPQVKIERSLTDLKVFPHVKKWSVDQQAHDAKRDAFSRKQQGAREMSDIRARLNKLVSERRKKTWKESEERAFDRVIQDVKKENVQLVAEEKLMLRRTRKYRLFPTKEQEKTLKKFMGTCRWTYNQAVAHFRKTNEFNAFSLGHLYVTKTSKKARVYPDGMSPPLEWAFDTPKTLRQNTLRTFQTNVKSALSNKKNRNISKFKIGFSSKKRSPFFTMSENNQNASIKKKDSKYFLSIPRLKNIRVKMDSYVQINSEIDILNSNGFWYVSIPEYVQPAPFENRNKCIALDPGIKAFMTGVDLEGNVLEFGHDTKTHLNKLRDRRNEAQSVISKFKNASNKSTYWRYRIYTRAKRAFLN